MSDPFISKQKRALHRFKKLDSARLDLDSLFKGIFAVIYEEIPFLTGWFFPTDPVSLELIPFSQQVWMGAAPQIEAGRLHPDQTLFPSVRQLLRKGSLCTRGEEWWTASQLTDHPFYQSVLKPSKLYHSLIVVLLDGEKKCRGYMTLWKKKNDGHFSDADFALMEIFSPVIGRLLQMLPGHHLNGHPDMADEKLHTLVRRRAQPGILILDQSGQIQYLNHDAKHLLDGLTANYPSGPSAISDRKEFLDEKSEKGLHPSLPKVVYQLYDQFKKVVMTGENLGIKPIQTVNRFCIHEGVVYLLRALLLQQHGAISSLAHIMILIEKVSQGVRADQVDSSVELTQREQEVVQLLLEGKTNKEVAVSMNIGEYTVKDHVKRIMKKLKVTTRAGIVAKILHYQNSG